MLSDYTNGITKNKNYSVGLQKDTLPDKTKTWYSFAKPKRKDVKQTEWRRKNDPQRANALKTFTAPPIP